MKAQALLVFFSVACCCAAGAATAKENRYPRGELLLEPAELARPEVAREFVILDVRKEDAYKQGHAPHARRVDHDAWDHAFEDGREAEGWSKRIGELRIRPDSKVVVYDDKGMKEAARIWWILRYWGVDGARLLNGTWKTWKARGYPVTAEVPPPAVAVDFKAAAHSGQLATLEQVRRSLKAHDLQIVDTRSEAEFCGIDKRQNKRGGAIPGAKHLDWSDLVDKETEQFKNADQMRRLFKQAGIDLDAPTACHCQSGGRASVMIFAMELMGARDARNYYRGWGEWGNRDDTPIEVSKAPAKR